MARTIRYATAEIAKRACEDVSVNKLAHDIRPQADDAAWELVNSFAEIEEGLTIELLRRFGADLRNAKELITNFALAFSADERKRMVDSLLKSNHLESRAVEAPIEFVDEESFTAIKAIEVAMYYRNLLAHNAYVLWIGENHNGLMATGIIVPTKVSYPVIDLLRPSVVGGRPNFLNFVWRLADSIRRGMLPQPRLFTATETALNVEEFIAARIKKQVKGNKDRVKSAEKRAVKLRDEILAAIAPNEDASD